MSNTITNLRLAKEHLFEKGWKKYGFGTINGPNCILGALRNGLYDYVPAEEELRTTLAASSECDSYIHIFGQVSITRFNDLPDTTFDDIVDLIDATIKRLEGVENV